MKILYLKLKGKTPLLMNNPKETLGESEGDTATKGRVKRPPPEEDAKKRRYLLPDDTFYIPAAAVRKCLLRASVGYTAKSETGRRAAVQAILSGALILSDPAFPLLDENDNPIPGDKYEVEIQRVTIQRAKASLWRGRPKIWPWKVLAWFLFDPRRVDLELVERIANDAGMYPGLLDFRPEKSGWFGTFEVEKIWMEELK
jgi:hypothetical protein